MGEILRDRYELLEVVGEGGEGTVVRALDRQHERIVALKIRRMSVPALQSDLFIEARVLLGIPPHPHLPIVREDFFDDGRYVIAMDWVEGTDLDVLLRTEGRPGLPVASVLRWLADAAAALTHLHQQEPSVVHGDLKPANLVLTAGGRVVLVDFGLSSSPTDRGRSGGTFGYSAPELVAGAAPSRASDIYALAATAWALLTGTPPTGVRPEWEGFEPDHAAQLEAAIRRGLATDPSHRPSTPGELVEGIRAGWEATLPTGVLTFCLTDIVGSSKLWESSPAAMARTVVRCDDAIASLIQAHGGRFLQSTADGDATVSAFVSVSQALAAAAEIPSRLQAEACPGGVGVPVRVALHTGETEFRSGRHLGPNLALASRLRELARAGEVIMSGGTADLVAATLPGGWGLVPLGPHRLNEGAAHVPVFALAAPGLVAPTPAVECPYPGLLPFDTADQDRYFGREAAVADVVARLAGGGLVAVIGSSGSGKSSLLRAGVAPHFDLATVITPTAVHRCPSDGDGLLVVDQFEELFTAIETDERRRFVETLLGRSGPVAIGIRADFYGHCGEDPGLAKAVAANQVLLGPMAEGDLRRAIVGPAESSGLSIEPVLVDLLVEEIAGEPGALPLLSHSLLATWQRRDGRRLTLTAYRETGGVRAAIATSADRLILSLAPDDRVLARSLLLRLIQPGDGTDDTRRRADLNELQPPDDPRRVRELISRLADARLVTVGEGSAEISHEALIREWPQLRTWLDEERDSLRVLSHLRTAANEWDRGGRDPGELYRGARLAATLEWADRSSLSLGLLESAFLDTCREREESELDEARARARRERRANRRLRGLLTGTALLLVVALVAGFVAVDERRRADQAASSARARAEEAELQRVMSESQVERTSRRDVAMLLALEADRLGGRPETRGNLFGTLQSDPDFLGYARNADGQPPFSAIAQVSGDRFVVGDYAGRLARFDGATNRMIGAPLQVLEPDQPVTTLVTDPSGTLLAVSSLQSRRIRLVSVASLEGDPKDGPGLGRTVETEDVPHRLALSADGRLAAGGSTTGRVTVLDVASGDVVGTVGGPAGRVSVAFAPDGTLASGSTDAVRLWGSVLAPLAELRSGGVKADGAIHFSADGRLLLSTGTAEQTIDALIREVRAPLLMGPMMWAVDERRPLWPAMAAVECFDVALLADRALCAHGSGQGLEYEPMTGRPLGSRFYLQPGGLRDVDVSPDQRTFAALSGGTQGRLSAPPTQLPDSPGAGRWSLDGRSPIAPVVGRPGLYPVNYNKGGSLLMTEAGQGPADVIGIGPRELWDTQRAQLVERLPVLAAIFAPDGRVAGIFPDRTSGILDLSTRHRTPLAPLRSLAIAGVAFDSAGRRIAIGYSDGVVEQRDLMTGQPVGELIRPERPGLDSLAYFRDGSVLAVAHNSRIYLYGADGGPPLSSLPPGTIAVSPDGSIVVTTTPDGGIAFRDPITLTVVGDEIPPVGARTNNLVMSEDNSLLLVASWDLSARVIDVASRRQLGDPIPISLVAGAAHLGATLRPDGRQLAVADARGVRLWNLDAEHWRRTACSLAGRNLTRSEWISYLPADEPYRATCPEWPPA